MRRSKNAGITFSTMMTLYSASLIIIGATYKMLLTEFTYSYQYAQSDADSDVGYDYDDGRHHHPFQQKNEDKELLIYSLSVWPLLGSHLIS